MIDLLIGAIAPLEKPSIQILTEQQIVVEAPPEIIEERELTIEEKIATNYYGCNEEVEYIRADNAKCLLKPVQRASRVNTQVRSQNTTRAPQNGSNSYSYGFCTHFAKEYTGWIPNGWGNANMWATNARNQGYTVSSTPIVGAVAQTSAGGLGHVAVVTAVGDGTVTVIEKNFQGWNIVSTRTVSVGSFVYIYP